MTSQVQEVYVFRVKQRSTEDSSHSYWRYIRDSHRSDYSANFVTKVDEATHFEPEGYQAIVAMYQKLVKGREATDVEFVKVKLETSIDVISMDSDAILEERRRLALTKLTHDDVVALGVEKFEIYNKLKFHNDTARPVADLDF